MGEFPFVWVKSLLPLDLLEDFCSSKTFSILDTSGISFSEFEDKSPINEKEREILTISNEISIQIHIQMLVITNK